MIIIDKIAYKIAQNPSILPPGQSPKDYDLSTLITIMANVMKILFSLAGVVAVIFIIIGAIKYAFSYGNPQTMQSAKSTLLWAILGLVIVLCSYTILAFVWKKFTGQSIFNPFGY